MNKREGRPRPYVGVSGVVCRKDVQPSGLVVTEPQQLFLEGYAQNAGLYDTGRMLALGVKATHKTQFEDIENKYGREWYPVGESEFTNALGDKERHPHVFGVAQAYLDVRRVDDAEHRKQFTRRVAYRGRKFLQAIQFDMLPWHHNDDVFVFMEKLKENHDLQVILQVHGEAMSELGSGGVVQKLGAHAVNIDYLLFDASHGTGKRLNAHRLDEFLEEAYSSSLLARTGFGVAGGLNAKNVREDIPVLLKKYPDLSWDAEGQLHPVNNLGKRPLQMDETKKYLQASADVLLRRSQE